MVKPLQACLNANSKSCAVEFPPETYYARSCAQKDFRCFFEPLHNCTEQRCEGKFESPACHEMNKNSIARENSFMRHGDKVLPSAYRHNGLLWLTSQLFAYIMRPNAKLTLAISTAKQKLNWEQHKSQGAILGVHIRWGDSCSTTETARTGRICSPVSEYLSEALIMQKLYGVTRVFLASGMCLGFDCLCVVYM
jgi:hypothetical protein